MSNSNANGECQWRPRPAVPQTIYQWPVALAAWPNSIAPTTDPSTGEPLAMIAQADIEDTRLAIQAARARL